MISKRSLRPRGQRLTLMVLVVLIVAAGGLAALLKWTGAWWWMSVTAAGLAVVVAGVGPLWQRWWEHRLAVAGKVRRSVRGTGGPVGDCLPTVAEVDLRMLRVHPAVIDVPYLHRTAKEQELRDQLCASRPVLLVGSSMVGKTRLAAAVVKDLYPDRPMLIPDTTSALAALDVADMLPCDHVIWLDDLDRYLSGDGLTAGLIMRLAERNAVVATMRAREWDRFRPTDQLRPPEWDALSVFERITLDRGRDRPNEDDLVRDVPDAEVRDRIVRVGIGEYVGAGQHIADQLALGAQSHPLGYALVLGAVDWRRTGVLRPVPAGLLPALAAGRLSPRQRTALADDQMYADALAWATREINPTVALLEPGDGAFTVYDFALDRLTATDDTPPADTWQLVIDNTEPGELGAIGYQAKITFGHHDIAEQAWRRAAENGHTSAMYNLGILLNQRGDFTEAETWYRSAANTGDTDAMSNLGSLLLKERGDLTEAETWYRKAAENGNTNAMNNLGALLKERGDLTEAKTWYRCAANTGDTDAMYNLGALLNECGDLTEAETWYRKAAENGNTNAMNNLGILLKRRGDLTEAKTWYRKAVENGNTNAMNNLGVLLMERGDLTEAETWYRKAVENGSTNAMNNLGVLLNRRGDFTEALTWWRAAEEGHTRAI
jgi:TPR repeat protein